MRALPHLHTRTSLFARVLGPYLLVAASTMLTRASALRTLLAQFDADVVWPWVTGAFVLPMGLTIIVLHPYWRGVPATIVSLLGWLTAFKGVALMTFPYAYLSWGNDVVAQAPWWQVGTVIVALTGLYLSIVGWATAVGRPASLPAARAAGDVPRAA